jgi:hypothetical protein
MLENNRIDYFSNKIRISINILLDQYKNDKKTLYKIFRKLYHLQTGLRLYKVKLEYLLLYTPLPRYFKVKDFGDLYLNICNRYSFHGFSYNNILMGNVIIPHPNFSPIPFFFQYKYKNKNYYSISNVYYYEISVDKESFREPWNNESIAIGIGCISTPILNNHVGWSIDTIGYHSDDGNFFSNNQLTTTLPTFGCNDVVGCGIEYCGEFNYKIFFTKNGELLPFSKLLFTTKKLTPMISLDHSAAITTNFGESNFCFDISQYNSPKVISTYNYFTQNYFRLSEYSYDSNKSLFNIKKKLIIKKKEGFNNFNTIKNIMFNSGLLEPLISNDQNELVNFLNNTENNNFNNNIIDNLKDDIEFLSSIKL